MEKTMSYTHLTLQERKGIFYQRGMGKSFRAIATFFGRSHSTIIREYHRNENPYNSHYYYETAHDYSLQRRHKPNHHRKWNNKALRTYVLSRLAIKWTPEIISNRIALEHPKDKQMRISAECIYQWVFKDAQRGGKLYKDLPRCHKKRRPQLRYGSLRGLLPGRRSIKDRPKSVENRNRYGHWEGDTIFGTRSSGYIATFVERKSRYLISIKLESKLAIELARKAIYLFLGIPQTMLKSLTLDNGKEFAEFKFIEKQTGLTTYFADPYSSWQRGSNEQVNGLIRRYFPKKMSFAKITDKMVQEVTEQINNRPRKCLNYRTPAEVLGGAL